MQLTLHARGPRPSGEVWERYAVPARWATWAPYITGVDCSDERIRPGSTGRVRGPLGMSAGFAVTAVDEDLGTWSWDVVMGPLWLSLHHGVRPSGRGTRTWLTVRGPATVVLPYTVPARLSLEMLVRRAA